MAPEQIAAAVGVGEVTIGCKWAQRTLPLPKGGTATIPYEIKGDVLSVNLNMVQFRDEQRITWNIPVELLIYWSQASKLAPVA